jgi:hypothetical protein
MISIIYRNNANKIIEDILKVDTVTLYIIYSFVL